MGPGGREDVGVRAGQAGCWEGSAQEAISSNLGSKAQKVMDG